MAKQTNHGVYKLWPSILLPLATKLGQGNIFRSVCQEFCPQGGGFSRPTPGGRGRGCIPACNEADTPQQIATAASGTYPTGMHSYYCPQRSWGKVMFLHVCVILFSVHVLSACWDTHPPWQGDPPGKETPPAQCMLGDTVNKRAVCILLECNSCSL